MIAEENWKREEQLLAPRLGYYDLLYWGEAVPTSVTNRERNRQRPGRNPPENDAG